LHAPARAAGNAGGERVRRQLGTPHGTLLNELRMSPEAVLRPLLEMVKYVSEISGSTSVHSSDAALIVYLVELAIDLETMLVFALQVGAARESR
jgi:hypothetical protein